MMFAGNNQALRMPECLFSGPLPLIFKSQDHSSDIHVEVKRSLSVNVDISHVLLPGNKRAVEVKLMDTNDPFFLWQTVIGEDDYFVMKREQGWVVDFMRFPAFMIGLVEKCQQYGNEQQPAFAAYFWSSQQLQANQSKADQATLSIMETNQYKQNCYVQLRMAPVSEVAMRKHLNALLSNYKEEIDVLRSNGSRLQPYSQPQPSLYEPYPNSTRTLEQKGVNYVERCKSLEDRLLVLDNKLRDLEQENKSLQGESAELKGQVKVLNQENDRLKQEIYSFKSSAQGAGISARMQGLEQLIREKDDALQRLNDLLEEVREGRGRIEESLREAQQQNINTLDRLRQKEEELQKAHDLIKRLQDDIRVAKTKVRASATLAQEQERLRREAMGSNDALRQDIASLRRDYDLRLKEMGELEEAKRRAMQELDEVKKVNEGNERVISWLHRLIPDEKLNSIIASGAYTGDSTFAERVSVQDRGVDSIVLQFDGDRPRQDQQQQQESESNTSTSTQYPLAMQREVRQMFAEAGMYAGPETSLPRFTPEELMGKQPISTSGDVQSELSDELDNRLSIV